MLSRVVFQIEQNRRQTAVEMHQLEPVVSQDRQIAFGEPQSEVSLRDALAAAGVDVKAAIASSQLVLDVGKSHPQELRDMLAEALAEIPDKYPLLRWAGVMSWALEKVPTTEKLMEWETHCNTVDSPAAVFLCQYELTTFLGTVVMDAMQTHPTCIVSNVIHQNAYYQDPEAYLEKLRRRDSTTLA